MTVPTLITDVLLRAPGSASVEVPGGETAGMAALARATIDLAVRLDATGIRRHDRVALVGTAGPAYFAAFFAATMCAVCAPLNPACRRAELESYLSDLRARALLLVEAEVAPAVEAAAALHVPVIRVTTLREISSEHTPGHAPRHPGPDDVAIALHTSGTTSRPKIVALTHGNLCASARNIAATLRLGPADRYLNIMPAFHVHGLMTALATLRSGGTLLCPRAFHAGSIVEWLRELRPTWYSAVPPLHHAILDRIDGRPIDHALRFVRSGSAPLAPATMAQIESTFGVPVIEAYGLTEAAHQVTSNPLPPETRKAGSVGTATGADVAIADTAGRFCGAFETGEVVIRGETVIAGYVDDPEATAGAFHGGWFRTGDQGYVDGDRYLFLTGRFKELIRRGGETIAPREVDEALVSHPAVAHAIAFPVPHRRLGEVVGAAVVLKPACRATEAELREHAAARLAQFKVPRVVRIVDELPVGSTGKIHRRGLASALGITTLGAEGRQEFAAPQGPIETLVANLWCAVLKIDRAGRLDDFFVSGGDSIAMADLLERVGVESGREISVAAFADDPTIAGLSRLIAAPGMAQG